MAAREPSMEDILASIKRVIAEEKEIRAAAPPPSLANEAPLPEEEEGDVLDLDASMAAEELPAEPVDTGPPLMEDAVADSSRARLEALATVAATAPPPAPVGNPLEQVVRDMLRPILKEWIDDHLPKIVDEHVKREITRITGRPL